MTKRKPRKKPVKPPELPSAEVLGDGIVYTIESLHNTLGISKALIRAECKLFREGKKGRNRVDAGYQGLPHCKLGKKFVFTKDDVVRWISQKIRRNFF